MVEIVPTPISIRVNSTQHSSDIVPKLPLLSHTPSLSTPLIQHEKARRGRQDYSPQVDERGTLRPLHDQTHEKVNIQQQTDLANPSPSSSIPLSEPTTSVAISEFIAKTPKQPPNRRNPKWVSRNQRGRGFRPRFSKAGREEEEGGKSKDGDINDLGSSGSFREEKECEEESKSDSIGERIEGTDSIEGADYIGGRLEELRLGAEEPELSEEQLRINDQLQEDELLVMESICGDNIFILDKQKGLRSFEIHIHAKAPSELTIFAKLTSSSDLESQTENSNEFSYSFKVQYLPPIVLSCLLPKSYPSHLSPYFTISVQWLDSGKISNLCSMLDSIWKGQPGQEVIYGWVEWLQTSSLSYLGFDKEIVLGPYGLRCNGDRRAISRSITPDVDIPSLKIYNDEQRHENFFRNFHECCICFSEFAVTLMTFAPTSASRLQAGLGQGLPSRFSRPGIRRAYHGTLPLDSQGALYYDLYLSKKTMWARGRDDDDDDGNGASAPFQSELKVRWLLEQLIQKYWYQKDTRISDQKSLLIEPIPWHD
ncbi:NDR1/HIN1-like 8 [Actinidia rufa]|uniref:NDR1/HIN1-like 8 n=1 Tax=Actinidia rufa TaxID=165716 RepID=A0A7J0GXA2_9ERIC|nr:NDR1/HIN1-like 8 [Actinidia rufa]